jgi:hypothetical protein
MTNNPPGVARRQVVMGAIAGTVAWAVAFGASTMGASGVFGTDSLSASAFFFYNAHLVPLSNVGGVTTASGNAVLEMLGPYGYAPVALPALVLLLAGAVLAWRSRTDSVRDAAAAGATVVVGYFVLSVVGALAFSGPFFGGVYRPNLLLAAVLAGVVFPVVFGALGALLGVGVGRLGARIRRGVA